MNDDGTIQQANLAAAVHSRSAARLTGLSAHTLLHDQRISQADCQVCSQLNQKPKEFLVQLALPNQQTIECHVAPFSQRLGKSMWVMVVRDVTQREHLLQDLTERVKEVRCLNQINQLCNDHKTDMAALLSQAVEIIPSGFLYPDHIRLNIQSEWGSFGDQPSSDQSGMQSVFQHGQQQFGVLRVWYVQPENMPEFTAEEQNLIDHITSQLTGVHTRLQSQARVLRLSYLYKLLSSTNRVIAHSQNQYELFTECSVSYCNWVVLTKFLLP